MPSASSTVPRMGSGSFLAKVPASPTAAGVQVSATSNEQRLRYDIILGSLGARYGSYCANLSRTLLVDPSKQQEAEYKWALPLLLHLINLFPVRRWALGSPFRASVCQTKAQQLYCTDTAACAGHC